MEHLLVLEMSIVVPAGLDFSDLRLARDWDGTVAWKTEPVEAVCASSGIDFDAILFGPECFLEALILTWYRLHLAAGGDRDRVADRLIAESTLLEIDDPSGA